MDDILVGISVDNESLQNKTFIFLIKLMGYRNQLRMNHWQTNSYAEHKLTDDIMESLTGFIDEIGEATLGYLGRPKINTMSTNISDISIASTDYILKCLNTDITEMISLFKETEYEGILALLGELDADAKKFTFLSTLN